MFKVTAAELMAYHERYVAKWGGKAVELEFDELYIDKGGVHEEAEEAQEAQEVQEAQEGVHEDLHQDLHDSTTASHPLQIDLNNVILDPHNIRHPPNPHTSSYLQQRALHRQKFLQEIKELGID